MSALAQNGTPGTIHVYPNTYHRFDDPTANKLVTFMGMSTRSGTTPPQPPTHATVCSRFSSSICNGYQNFSASHESLSSCVRVMVSAVAQSLVAREQATSRYS